MERRLNDVTVQRCEEGRRVSNRRWNREHSVGYMYRTAGVWGGGRGKDRGQGPGLIRMKLIRVCLTGLNMAMDTISIGQGSWAGHHRIRR